MRPTRAKKRVKNVTISRDVAGGLDVIATLEGSTFSGILEHLAREEIRRRGIERIFTAEEIEGALSAARKAKAK